MKDFSKTLIRCSALGQIMRKDKAAGITDMQLKEIEKLQTKEKELTEIQSSRLEYLIEKRDSGGELSKTAKSFLIRSYAVEKYYREKEITTKPMIKGHLVEEDAINLFIYVESKWYEKNTIQLRNDFISGTPDLHTGLEITDAEEVIDIKSSWDIFTFLSNIGKEINTDYYWQLQGYMALTGARIGTLAYCLVDTPDVIIQDEMKRLFYKMNVATEENEEYKAVCKKLEFNMKFDDIPREERVLRFSVERNDSDIEKIYKRVQKCRQFLNEFQEQHLFFTKHHRKSLYNSIKTEELVGNTED